MIYNWSIFHLHPLSILTVWLLEHSFISHNMPRPNHVAGCKALPEDHIPSHSFTEGLSGLSALSFSPPFLPPLIVLLGCLTETCWIRACLFPYQKVRYHHGSYWREIFIIIMTRNILVLFDNSEFNWAIFIGYTVVLSVRSSTNHKRHYQKSFFQLSDASSRIAFNCEEVLCTILIRRTGLGI